MAAHLKVLQLTAAFLLASSLFVQAKAVINSRKLDDDPTITPPGFENKCGDCPCNTPCVQSPPPPSPPPPPPPSPPPPPKKMKSPPPPPTTDCPPPPCAQCPVNPPYIYINGPPGNVYPIDPYRSGSTPSRSYPGILPFLIAGAVVGFLWCKN